MSWSNLIKEPVTTPNWLREIAVLSKSLSYCCSKCDEKSPDTGDDAHWPHQYKLDGHLWPMIYNHHYYNTIDGYGYNWDEYYKCLKCKTIYYYNNGT
jgi:hypothetical protein